MMRTSPRAFWSAVMGALILLGLGILPASAHSFDESADVILQGNHIARRDIGVGGQPFVQTRRYAMVHVAMADAVLAIDDRYAPLRVRAWAPPGASKTAAAAKAARDILVSFFPANQADYDATLAATLATIPPGRGAAGADVGKRVAAAVLAWRENDGFATANPQPSTVLPSTLPGIWRRTASGSAQYSELGYVEPFGVLTPYQFLPAAPPQLESAEYAQDFNDVKSNGRATGSTRTPEQTRFALLFAGAGAFANVTNPFRLWHTVARDVAVQKRLSLVDTARLFALLSVAIHDGLQTAHASKYVYRLWRPETAIDQAAIDGNAATDAEAGWQPLIVAPPYPSHSSNMSCIGVSAARMLADVIGTDNVSFTATWLTGGASPAVVHAQPYTSFWAMAADQGSSRVWGGVHYRFEITASEAACLQVADFIFERRMRPRQRH
jgi:hypothetical protein